MPRTKIVAATAALLATTDLASAQAPPRTFSIDVIRASCVRQYSDPANCDRTADIVRQRYGTTVTMMQWNAGAGVVRHMHRQGKFAR